MEQCPPSKIEEFLFQIATLEYIRRISCRRVHDQFGHHFTGRTIHSFAPLIFYVDFSLAV